MTPNGHRPHLPFEISPIGTVVNTYFIYFFQSTKIPQINSRWFGTDFSSKKRKNASKHGVLTRFLAENWS